MIDSKKNADEFLKLPEGHAERQPVEETLSARVRSAVEVLRARARAHSGGDMTKSETYSEAANIVSAALEKPSDRRRRLARGRR